MKLTATTLAVGIALVCAGCSGASPASHALAACDAYLLYGPRDSTVSPADRKSELATALDRAQTAAAGDSTWKPMYTAIAAVQDFEARNNYSDRVSIDNTTVLATINNACMRAGEKP